MSLREEISADLAEAFDTDLADAVKEFTATRETGEGSYDPVTETWTPSALPYTGRGVFGNYAVREIDGVHILATDTKLTALQAEVTEAPQVGDVIAGMSAQAVSQDAAAVSWIVQLRKV